MWQPSSSQVLRANFGVAWAGMGGNGGGGCETNKSICFVSYIRDSKRVARAYVCFGLHLL